MSTRKDQIEYNLTHGFMWWVLHAFFKNIERYENEFTDALLDKINDFEIQIENFGEMVFQEGKSLGKSFVVNGQNVSIYIVLEQVDIEVRVIGWYRKIDDISNIFNANSNRNYEYLAYLYLGWVGYMIGVFDKAIQKVEYVNYNNDYQNKKQVINELREWFDNKLLEFENEYSLPYKIGDLNAKIFKLFIALSKDWNSVIKEATKSYGIL